MTQGAVSEEKVECPIRTDQASAERAAAGGGKSEWIVYW